MPIPKKAFTCGWCYEIKGEDDLADPDGMWEQKGVLMGTCHRCCDEENLEDE